jgi:peroxiredoxin
VNALRLATLSAALFVFASLSAAADDSPVNTMCSLMKGKPIRPGVTSVYKGKTVGFCCNKCKAQFDADPDKWAAKFAELKQDPNPAQALDIGKKAPAFKLKDTDGKEQSLTTFKGKIVVLAWIDPASKDCARFGTDGLLAKLAKDLKAIKDDVVFLPVTSSDGVDAPAFAKFLEGAKVEAKGLMDSDGKYGKSMGVKWTPEAFVIDGTGVLRYTGAIDDDADGKKADKAVNYVTAAVKAIVDGKPIDNPSVKPYGGEIKFKK